MWPLAAILGTAIGGGVFLCVTGILVTMSVQRHRHRQVLQAHGLSRGLSKYHRSKLSATDNNYFHVTPPNSSLRDSSCVPADVEYLQSRVPGRGHRHHRRTGSHWSIKRKDPRVDPDSSDPYILNSPKRRHQKRTTLPKPMGKIHQHPLPMIQETVPGTRLTSSASAFVAELSGDSPTSRPPQELDSQSQPDSSRGWPLTSTVSNGATPPPTEVFSRVARPSVIRRIGGLHHLVTRDWPDAEAKAPTASNEGRTILPTATWDPPAMIPSNDTNKEVVLPTARANSSFDTLGSSLLTVVLSPSTAHPRADHTSLSDFEFELERKRSAASLDTAMCNQMPIHTGVGIRTAKSSVRSLHPTLDVVEQTWDDPTPDHQDPFLPPTVFQQPFSERPGAGYWIDMGAVENPRWRLNASDKQRHSMLEASEIRDLRTIGESMTTQGVKCGPFQPLPQRPASIAITHPLQWQKQGYLPRVSCRRSSPDSAREDWPQPSEARTEIAPVIHSLSMDKAKGSGILRGSGAATRYEDETFVPFSQPRLLANAVAPARDNPLRRSQTRSPSGSHFTLTPSVHTSYVQASSETSGTPRPDSDIFSTAYVNMNIGASRDHRGDKYQWYISPQQSVKGEPISTPPSSRRSELFDSPILPSPALQTSTLYHRKLREGRDVNLKQTTSEGSPVQSRPGGQYRATEGSKIDPTNARRQGRGTIRTMRSERNLVGMTATRTSQHIALSTGRHNTELNDYLTPPVNKRISGLRASSSNPSISTISPYIMTRPRGKASPARQAVINEDGSRMLQVTRMRNAHHTVRASPSIASLSGVSIWEDASVSNASSELDISTPPPLRITARSGSGSGPRRSPHNRPMYLNRVTRQGEDFQHEQQRQFLARQFQRPPKHPVKDLPHEYEDMESSVLVQRLERVVSNGRWDDELHSQQEVESGSRNVVVGLGLRNGNVRVGEPDSFRRPILYS